jgi:hypothetical protein
MRSGGPGQVWHSCRGRIRSVGLEGRICWWVLLELQTRLPVLRVVDVCILVLRLLLELLRSEMHEVAGCFHLHQ